ncbi:MAG: methyltransferase, partial [Spirochaetaceae bacterium]|nr:methyltransferase [Spirochaetaceae bacterium]
MKDEGIEFICKYIKEHNIKRILEIGSAIGYSAIKFASIADDIRVTTLEIDEERYEQAVQNIKKCGLESRISIHLCDALLFETDS